jgi:hypothetical protein
MVKTERRRRSATLLERKERSGFEAFAASCSIRYHASPSVGAACSPVLLSEYDPF